MKQAKKQCQCTSWNTSKMSKLPLNSLKNKFRVTLLFVLIAKAQKQQQELKKKIIDAKIAEKTLLSEQELSLKIQDSPSIDGIKSLCMGMVGKRLSYEILAQG